MMTLTGEGKLMVEEESVEHVVATVLSHNQVIHSLAEEGNLQDDTTREKQTRDIYTALDTKCTRTYMYYIIIHVSKGRHMCS